MKPINLTSHDNLDLTGDEDIAADLGVSDDDFNLATGVSPQNAELGKMT